MATGLQTSRPRRTLNTVFFAQGALGLTLILYLTVRFSSETGDVLLALGSDAWILCGIFFFTAIALQGLRFELTKDLHVALGLTAYIAMYPLLGIVVSAWLAVLSAIAGRIISQQPNASREESIASFARMASFFGTYGIPVAIASWVYLATGGHFGREIELSTENVIRLAGCGLLLIAANSAVMLRAGVAMGLSWREIARLYSLDSSIYVLTLPLSIVITLSFNQMGWGAIAALMTQLIVAYAVTRKMAIAQKESSHLLQRLASLTNVGRAISLTTTDNLLMTVYTECKKVIDTTIFSIALLDEKSGDLMLELFIENDEILAKQRIPAGEGLNAWVVRNHAPLLLGSHAEETEIGVIAFDDGIAPTQAWLGVPMIARDKVVGVISVQSYRQNVFTQDDALLLTSIANQAAVAIDNAKLYEELEDLTYALEERVQERTNELRETNLQLMAADRAKNEFLAKMSHELRTPLNSIIGFSSVLIQTTRNEIPPNLYKFLENIHTAGNHLLSLINDILDLSKIEAGKVELRPDTFDMRETVIAVERVMKGFAAEANVTITADVEPDVPLVTLDEGRLKQILFNLLSNAVKFSPEGGPVTLTVRRVARSESPLRLNSICIEVKDSGVGIPAEDVTRIFDEFYQSDQGRSARKGGTGLGLSLTRNFVELHRGTIDVSSEPGKGSRFTLYLPIDCRQAGVYPTPRLYPDSRPPMVH